MQNRFFTLAAFFALTSFACGPLEYSSAGFCVASELEGEDLVEGSYDNVRLLSFDEERAPPQEFQRCANGMGVEAQLEREDGVIIFLAVEIESSIGRLSQGVTERFEGADIRFLNDSGGFGPNAQSLSIVDEQGPIILLEHGRRFELNSAPGLNISAGDTVGFVHGEDECFRGKDLEVVFETTSGIEKVRPLESVELVINGLEGHGHNLGTYDLEEPPCTDVPPSGIYANWAFTDASF